MIIENSSDIKKLIEKLNFLILERGISIKRQRLYQIFAQSQGFNTDAALRAALPIWVENSEADGKIVELINQYGIKQSEDARVRKDLVSAASFSVQPFPIIATRNFCVAICINWEFGTLSLPFTSCLSSPSVTPYEFYGNESTIAIAF